MAKKTQTYGTPYPWHRAPSKAACAEAVAVLTAMHGEVHRDVTPPLGSHGDASSCGAVPNVLDALFATILSQNTTQKNSTAAMAELTQTFGGDHGAMRRAGAPAIAKAIYQGGLSQVKSRVMLGILDTLAAGPHGLSLEHLRQMNDADAKAALEAFDGVGPKTASCVLLFCLDRESFAVDTHVHRIAKRLSWVPQTATRDQTHDHLEELVPAALKYPLHVLLVTHGKCCLDCAANGRPQRPPLGPCPLQPLVAAGARAAARAAKRAHTRGAQKTTRPSAKRPAQ